MSKKVVGPLLIGAAIAINVVPGVGQIASLGLSSALGATGIGAATAVSLTSSILAGVSLGGLTAGLKVAGIGPKSPRATLAQLERLSATINPSAPRKFVFGAAARGVSVRFA